MMLDSGLIARNIPVGSSLYYSLRFSPTTVQDELQTLLVWYRELCNIPRQVSDKQVAQAKLSWWHQELHQAVRGGSRLPLATKLSHLISKHQLPLERFNEIVEGLLADLVPAPHDEWQALLDYAQRTGGNIAELLSRVNGAVESDDLELARQLGSFIHLVELMRDLGLILRRQSNPIPVVLMRQHDLTNASFEGEDAHKQVSQLLSEMSRQLRHYYNEAALPVIGHAKPQLLPVLIQAELAIALLDTLEKSGFQVLDQRISLTPLRKLWLAWRSGKRKSLKQGFPESQITG